MPYPYIFAAIILLVILPLYLYSKRSWPRWLQLIIKASGTFMCLSVALGYCAGTSFTDNYAVLILTGLCVSLFADIFIEILLPAGGGLFAIAHVAYITAFLLTGITAWSILAFALLAICVGLVYKKYRLRMPKLLRLPVAGYGLILCVFGALAMPQPFVFFSVRTLLAAIGSALFIASDLTLCANLIEKRGFKHQYISLGMYYTGQLLLALSVAM